jgi:hypothetical protein
VIIFGLVQFGFYKKKSNQNQLKKTKLNRKRFKLTDFGSVILGGKPVWLGFFPV